MKYYEILNFQDEPFSNSPDPDFFYESPKHSDCLNRLEIALRLKRGLNVVLGDIGTGKTTLCRRLLRVLADDESVDAYLLLDPDFDNPRDLLLVLCEMLEHAAPEAGLTEWTLKERVKDYLFKRGVDENKTTVLIIDEGQKIHDRCMELLRELLNYETNDAKLLQIVIFAQLEFEPTIRRYPNFADRINDLIRLGPLDFSHTKELINYRINLAKVHMSRTPLFTWGGYLAMYRATGGYPRKIVKLAHKVFLTLILNNDHRATWSLVRSVSKENYLAENTNFPTTKSEIGASKSLFAPPKSPSFEMEGEDIEGARFAWAAGVTMLLLVLLVAGPAETPTTEPLIVGNGATVYDSANASIKLDATKIAQEPQKDVAHPVVSAPQPEYSALAYRARIIAPASTHEAEEPAPEILQKPGVLGSITTTKDILLATLVEQVYGRQDESLIQRVIAANDILTGGEVVAEGSTLTFPVVETESSVTRTEGGSYVVQVGRYDSLAAAYEARSSFVEAKSLNTPQVAILPQWNTDTGMVFRLVYAKLYDDEGDAVRAMHVNKDAATQTPEIIASWENDAVLLADVVSQRAEQNTIDDDTQGLFPPPGP